MSKTPRTEAAIHKFWMGGAWSKEFADFARQLEAENAELREALAKFACECGKCRCKQHGDEHFQEDCERFQARALLAKVNG